MSSEESRCVRALKRWAKEAGRLDAVPHQQHLECIARKVGFSDYRSLLRMLELRAPAPHFQGTLWYSHRCSGTLGAWFTTHEEARSCLSQGHFCFPYRNQFVVTGIGYLESLGLQGLGGAAWNPHAADFVANYGSKHWEFWATARIHQLRRDALGEELAKPAIS